jgi:acylphosphatase
MTQVRVVIHGRVQGVWFRGWTVEEARARGLNGWVRNRRDGTVEATFEGPDDAVASMLEACREGPPAARVTEVEEFPSGESLDDVFSQRQTS